MNPISRESIPQDAQPGFAVPKGQGRPIWYAGNLMEFKLDRQGSQGQLTFIEVIFRRGEEPPVHVHHREDELYYVLDGELTFYVGDQEFDASPGTLIFLPRDVPHALVVKGPARGDGSAQARLILQWFPANRLEEYFQEMGEVAPEAVLPPPPGPLDPERLAAALTRHDIDILGPPPSLVEDGVIPAPAVESR
jgi:quercetin dioxygenase-like cupin family protein